MKCRRKCAYSTIFMGIIILTFGFILALSDIVHANPEIVSTQEILSRAKSEGKVTFYTALSVTVAEELAKIFESNYGIKVEIIRTGSERLYSRLLQEYDAGIHTADVINISNLGYYNELKRSGKITSYSPPGVKENFRPKASDPDGTWFGGYGNILLIVYNKEKVASKDIPKRWDDLLNSKWNGKIVTGHPGYSGYSVTFTSAILDIYGESFYKKLKLLNPMVVQATLDSVRIVISGERPVGLGAPFQLSFEQKRSGAPIDFVLPEEGAVMSIDPVSVLTKAPHPNAARVFMGFYLSRDTQLLMTQKGYYSYRSDITYSDRPSLEGKKLILPKPDDDSKIIIEKFKNSLEM